MSGGTGQSSQRKPETRMDESGKFKRQFAGGGLTPYDRGWKISELGSGPVSIRVAGVERSEPPDAVNSGGSQSLDPSHPRKVSNWPTSQNYDLPKGQIVLIVFQIPIESSL